MTSNLIQTSTFRKYEKTVVVLKYFDTIQNLVGTTISVSMIFVHVLILKTHDGKICK